MATNRASTPSTPQQHSSSRSSHPRNAHNISQRLRKTRTQTQTRTRRLPPRNRRHRRHKTLMQNNLMQAQLSMPQISLLVTGILSPMMTMMQTSKLMKRPSHKRMPPLLSQMHTACWTRASPLQSRSTKLSLTISSVSLEVQSCWKW